jgi:hypothetical protein
VKAAVGLAGRLDVSKMEALIEGLLAKQLARIYELAAGRQSQAD